VPTIDFDAFRAERAAEPVTIRLGGKDYELPTGLPAPVALELIRLKREHGDTAEVPAKEIERFARLILGPSGEEIIASVSIEELGQLLLRLLEVYSPPNLTSPATETEKEPASL